jgi:hypothetical protein
MRTAGLVLVVAPLVCGTRLWAQASGSPAAAAAKVLEPGSAPHGTSVSRDGADRPTGNLTQLQVQTERLAAMASELKARVDKTNKDVLSVAVVQQAQAIEQYAHQLKQGSPKH